MNFCIESSHLTILKRFSFTRLLYTFFHCTIPLWIENVQHVCGFSHTFPPKGVYGTLTLISNGISEWRESNGSQWNIYWRLLGGVKCANKLEREKMAEQIRIAIKGMNGHISKAHFKAVSYWKGFNDSYSPLHERTLMDGKSMGYRN